MTQKQKITLLIIDWNTNECDKSIIEVESNDEINYNNFQAFREAYPNCIVNMKVDGTGGYYANPLNMEKDATTIPVKQYFEKWYNG